MPDMSRRGFIIFFGAVGAILSGLAFFLVTTYAHRVLPGVRVGDISIGGAERDQVRSLLRERLAAMNDQGIMVELSTASGTRTAIIEPVVVTEEAVRELIETDIETATDALLSYGKRGGFFHDFWAILRAWVTRPSMPLTGVIVDAQSLRAALQGRLLSEEVPVENARIQVRGLHPLTYEILEGSSGVSYDYDTALREITDQWVRLTSPRVTLRARRSEPEITRADVLRIAHRLEPFFAHGDMTLVFTHGEDGGEKIWTIAAADIAHWVEPKKLPDGEMVFGLAEDAVRQFLVQTLQPRIDRSAQDAKFRIDAQGKVAEFRGSRIGITLDISATVHAIQERMAARTRHDRDVPGAVSVVVSYIEPITTTGQANHLGITEVLGVGTSDFSGSPVNRVKNIRHAVEKLDGTLVKPGDIFSTLAHVGPFTEADGYVPELVIKGDALEPEIGGGLCQIGTTLFRMAMNSGLPIVSRRNHSLVVRYYGDPRNGNPGTDATIYDPAPDFRFENDTGNHILVETRMDEETQELFFTLWGTSDGRTASYTAPVVSEWIPHGEKKIIETTTLPPGDMKCQKPFLGAEASFTYSRILADGTRDDQVFESYYRPLPEICLLGSLTPSASSTLPQVIGSPNG